MSFGKIAVCLTLAGILGSAGCRHVASESRAPATVKEQLDSQGAPAGAAAKEGEAKPAEGEAKPAEGEAKPAEGDKPEGEAKPAEGEAKPEPGSEDKE